MSLLIYLIILVFLSSLEFHKCPGDDDVGVFAVLRKHISRIMTKVLINDTDTSLSVNCRESAYQAYLNETNSENFFYKLIKDSSKNKNDVGSYVDCSMNKYGRNITLDDFTYLIVYLKTIDEVNRTDIRYEENNYMFGLCVKDYCDEAEYEELLKRINLQFYDIMHLGDQTKITVYNVNAYHEKITRENGVKIFIYLIPLFFLLIHLIFMCYPKIPMCLFKCLFRSKNSDLSDESRSGSERLVGLAQSVGGSSNIIFQNSPLNELKKTRVTIDKTKLFTFKAAFSLSKNGEELFSTKQSVFNNNSGLGYLNGIRAVSMIFLIFGFGFFALYNSTLKVYEPICFYHFLKNPFFSFIFIGFRYAPRILFSCSGFSFIYKFFCYLDENSTVEHEVNVSYYTYLKFLANQFYKYLIYLWAFVFFKYSFIYFFSLLSDAGPMWVFFKINVIDEISFKSVLGHIFLYENFIFLNECHIFVFFTVISEIIFFLFSSVIIFIAYKRNVRIDIILIILFLVLISFRFIFCFIIHDMHPTLFYYFDNYGSFFMNPIYNYPFYLIGMFFGSINYTIQKGMRKRDIINKQKNYLLLVVAYAKTLKKRSKCCSITFITLYFILISLFSYFVPLMMHIFNAKEHLTDYFLNPFLNIWLLIDIEFVVILVHLGGISIFLLGENFLLKFLNYSLWVLKSRMYYSYIIMINPILIYVFYHSESRITLDYFNIFFFSVVNYVVVYLASCFCYIVIELPFKKLSKMFFKEDKDEY